MMAASAPKPSAMRRSFCGARTPIESCPIDNENPFVKNASDASTRYTAATAATAIGAMRTSFISRRDHTRRGESETATSAAPPRAARHAGVRGTRRTTHGDGAEGVAEVMGGWVGGGGGAVRAAYEGDNLGGEDVPADVDELTQLVAPRGWAR